MSYNIEAGSPCTACNLRTSDSGNGNHSVSLPIILIKIKVDQDINISFSVSISISQPILIDTSISSITMTALPFTQVLLYLPRTYGC